MDMKLLEMMKGAEIIDLTYKFGMGMCKYPSDPEPVIVVTPAIIVDGNHKSGYTEMHLRNHHGTHIDAPSHKIPGGKSIVDYGVEKFMNNAAMIDLGGSGLLEREQREVTLDDVYEPLKRLDKEIGALIIYTGFCDKIDSAVGQDPQQRKAFELSFPYIGQEAAFAIASKYPALNIIGIDSFALDKRGSNSEVHRRFMENDTLPLETLANLSRLKAASGNDTFYLMCAPTYPGEIDASPARAYAIVEKK